MKPWEAKISPLSVFVLSSWSDSNPSLSLKHIHTRKGLKAQRSSSFGTNLDSERKMKKRMSYSLIAIMQIMSCISVTSRPLESYDAALLQGSLFMPLYIHVSLYNICLILSLLLAYSFFFFRFLLQLFPPQKENASL